MRINPGQVHETLSKYMLVDGYHVVVDLEKSHDGYLIDARTGKEYIDFYTYFASSALGHNHPGLMKPDFKEKIFRAAINKPANSDTYTVEMAEFVKTFMEVTAPDYLQRVFFIDGGALAVENAMKTAFDWKVRKNFAKGIKEEKGLQIMYFNQAFHGRSGYTLTITNTFDPKKTKHFPKFDWPKIDNPKLSYPLTDGVLEEVKAAEKRAIEQIEKACADNPDDIAALIIEPIQGEGGDNHFRKEFMQELSKLSKKHEFLFIMDEVQTGLGITGKMWAHEWYDIKPDIICFGKKTQVCGILAGERIAEVENHVFKESSRINSTWGGNLTDMVRATRILEIIKKDNLVENAKEMGDYLVFCLRKIQEKIGMDFMNNIRGKGLFIACDMPNTEIRDKVMGKIMEDGLLALPSGEKSIRFRPALTIAKETIDKAMQILEKLLIAAAGK